MLWLPVKIVVGCSASGWKQASAWSTSASSKRLLSLVYSQAACVQATILDSEERRRPVVSKPATAPAFKVDGAHAALVEVGPPAKIDERRFLAGVAEHG
jgi:hypothetical protein